MITVFIPGGPYCSKIAESLKLLPIVDDVFVLSGSDQKNFPAELKQIESQYINSSDTLISISKNSSSKYILLFLTNKFIIPGKFSLERFIQVAENTSAGYIYS